MREKKGSIEKMQRAKKRIKSDYSLLIIRSLIIMGAIIFWELKALSGDYNPIFTSYPSQILEDLGLFFSSGELYKHLSITLLEVFSGLVAGTFFGVALAICFRYFLWLGKLLIPIISAISCIPQLALAPIYVLWFGLGLSSKMFLAGLMVFFNVFSATHGAIKSMDRGILESASLLGAGNVEMLKTIVLPSCLPWILSGIRGGIGAALIGAIIGEYIGSKGGLGWMITYSTSFFKVSRVMSCIVVLLLVGLVLNKLLDLVERRVLVWRKESTLRIEKTSTNY